MTEATVDVAATTSAKRPSESTERSVVSRESNAKHAYVLPPNPNPYETPPLGPVAAPPPPVVMITSAHTNAEAGPTGDQPDSAHTGYALAVVPAAAPLLVPHALPRPADTTATATTATAAVAASASVSAPRSPHPNASAMPPASARAQPMPSSPAKALIGTRQMVTARDFPNGEYTGSTKIVAIDAAGQAMHVREGTGKLRYRNGNWYEGDWAGDKAEGRGRFCWAKSGSTYEGDWRDDQKHGTGTYVYHNSKENYAGEWKRDRKHGKGEYVYASGSKYTGDFVDGVAEGRGEYVYHTGASLAASAQLTWHSGDRYVGEWKRDKPNGKGCFFYANGTRFEGTFVDDRKTGPGVLYEANGTVHDGNWIDGVKTGVCRVSDPDRRQHYIEEWFEGNLLERKVVPAEPQQAVASRS